MLSCRVNRIFRESSMNNILVATDLSERSDRALRRALRLAREQGALCHVLAVVDDNLPADLAENIRLETEASLRLAVDDAAATGDRVAVEAVLGDVLRIIPTRAESLNAALVVLGLHRPRDFLDTWRETTMERLVQMMQRPVLLVKQPGGYDYARVLVPISFSAACAAALKTAHDLAPKAAITTFHSVHIPFAGLTGDSPTGTTAKGLVADAKAQAEVWARSLNLPPEQAEVPIIIGSLNAVFERQREKVQPDLIALGAHTRASFSFATLGSFAADLIRKPPTDLLITRPLRA